MPRLTAATPKYRHHRASGQAVVTIAATDHYLGPWKSKASKVEYDRLIGEWLVAGRPVARTREPHQITVTEIVAAQLRDPIATSLAAREAGQQFCHAGHTEPKGGVETGYPERKQVRTIGIALLSCCHATATLTSKYSTASTNPTGRGNIRWIDDVSHARRVPGTTPECQGSHFASRVGVSRPNHARFRSRTATVGWI